MGRLYMGGVDVFVAGLTGGRTYEVFIGLRRYGPTGTDQVDHRDQQEDKVIFF
jgi:hypothetical protein